MVYVKKNRLECCVYASVFICAYVIAYKTSLGDKKIKFRATNIKSAVVSFEFLRHKLYLLFLWIMSFYNLFKALK